MGPPGPAEKKLHIVLVPMFAQGHLPPMIHLAHKLAAEGFIVTILNIDSIHAELMKRWSCPLDLDIRLQGVVCNLHLPAGVDAKTIQSGNEDFLSKAELMGEQVEKLLRNLHPAPCCLIADFFYSWPATVAKRLCLMPVTYWPGAASWSALHHFEDLLVSAGDAYAGELKEARSLMFSEDIDYGERTISRTISYIPGVDEFKHEDLPDYFRIGTKNEKAYHDACKDRMRDSEWTLVNSLEMELEPKAFSAMRTDLGNRRFVSIGPLFPLRSLNCNVSSKGSLREEDCGCVNWLDSRPPQSVLYISLGSITYLSEEAFEELAAGIEASKKSFVWVIRPDSLLDRTPSTEKKFNDFVARTREQGIVVSWAPQLRVLAHSSVAGFLSHCGWNSVFESICSGVPVLCWPRFADQRLNCKMVVEDWGFGSRFSKSSVVGRSEAEEKIVGFMQEAGELRDRMRTFGEKVHAAVGEGGSSHENLQEFMHALRSRG